MGKLQVVVGGQFGSEGKGAICGYLARREEADLIGVRVAGPNAGHTVINPADGQKIPLRQVPVSLVTNTAAGGLIAAGSEIDEAVLIEELNLLDNLGLHARGRLMIDAEATIIQDSDKLTETRGQLCKTGTTGKGIGSARARRIMREAPLYGDGWQSSDGTPHPTESSGRLLQRWLASEASAVQIEGTQGYGLGLHAGYYPHCTSSDCRAIDFMAMAGVSPWVVEELDLWVVLRTYPIRIAGPSGPLLNETSWETLRDETRGYIEPEQTTVTHKTRRVGGWDPRLARAACQANPGAQVALTFFDYWFPELAGQTSERTLESRHQAAIAEAQRQAGAPVVLLGTGPNSVIDLRKGV